MEHIATLIFPFQLIHLEIIIKWSGCLPITLPPLGGVHGGVRVCLADSSG